jgi:uridine phosphorylase
MRPLDATSTWDPTNDAYERSKTPPILRHKNHEASSAFTPENLLRQGLWKNSSEHRRPRNLHSRSDGDVTQLTCHQTRQPARGLGLLPHGAYAFRNDEHDYGIVGSAVGAAFAVLIAEELFASGCRLLISITSAGQIAPVQSPPYFVVIDRALRDEGTSYHYLPASAYSEADVNLTELASAALAAAGMSVRAGASWTTDAPFRETEEEIAAPLHAGILTVGMEAEGLYAFAKARGQAVVCFAHVTNQMGRVDEDFEKGVSEGAEQSLRVISLTVDRWRKANTCRKTPHTSGHSALWPAEHPVDFMMGWTPSRRHRCAKVSS